MRLMVVTAISCVVYGASIAGDAHAAVRKSINIPAQNLGTALQSLARYHNVQLVYFSKSIDALNAPGAVGELTIDEALGKLLSGSGFGYRYLDDNTITIVSEDAAVGSGRGEGHGSVRRSLSGDRRGGQLRMRLSSLEEAGPGAAGGRSGREHRPEDLASSADVPGDSNSIAEIIVSGVRFYQPKEGRAALKSDVPLLETPLSVSVITSEQIEARAADSLEQAFRYTAGVHSLNGGANRHALSTSFMVRGFNVTGSAPLYVNGSKFPINTFTVSTEPYFYESVELLKGPASVLYGQAAPGGIINLTTKRSTGEPLRSVKLQAGSWDHREINADFGGPLTSDGSLGYRVTGLVRDGHTRVEQIPDERAAVSAVLDWMPSDRTTLSLLTTYSDANTVFDEGRLIDGSALPNPNGEVAPDLFTGEPGFSKSDSIGYTVGYLFSHRFNDVFQVRQNLLVFDYELDYASVFPFSVLDTATRRVVARLPYARTDTDRGWSVDTQLALSLRSSRIKHSILFGVDYSDTFFRRVNDNGVIGPMDIYAPQYGMPITMNGTPTTTISDAQQVGVYAQDHIKIDDRWVMLVGGRWDDVKEIDAPGNSAFTKRLGLLYLSESGLVPYLSYAESFQPVFGRAFSGATFEPTEGLQYEIGLKYEPKEYNAALTVAAYDITQQNNLTGDAANPGFSVQTGEYRSKGLEAEGRYSFGRTLDLIGAYNYVHMAEVTESNGTDLGQKIFAVPDSAASLWVDYHHRVGANAEFSLGAGVRYFGKSMDLLNTVVLPSYTDFDISARYDTATWRFALNVKNLLNDEYVASCTRKCYYGDPRNITFSIQRNW